ncbi:MAG TPA: protein phosphatase 2C domain-containing protein, partial [Ktedonobacteraceae bacterium]|nr:protein phosphatase 2C domain-containing protein [Ktedonobacteraceae bacterium]
VLDLASVSVVRLVVTYKVAGVSPQTSTVECTGLGTLVGSWSPLSATDKNTWVLTDSYLINTSGSGCAGASAQLSGIEVLANATYTGTQTARPPLGQLLCLQSTCHDVIAGTPVDETINAPSSAGGGLLFSFHADAPQPFLPVAAANANTGGTPLGIELANGSNASATWPATPTIKSNLQEPTQFLVPDPITSTNIGAGNAPTPTATRNVSPTPSPLTTEPGMPFVGTDATLIGLYLHADKQLPSAQINTLLSSQPELQSAAQAPHKNSLQTNWMTGIKDYYSGDYQGADTALKAIGRSNPAFQAAQVFDTSKVLPALQRSHKNATPTVAGNADNGTILGLSIQRIMLVAILIGLLLLIGLLVVVSLTFGRARARRKREMAQFEADHAEAQRLAEIEAQRQQAKTTARLQSPFNTLRCPNCGAQVTASDSVCPNCHYLLSASDSGLHLRAVPPPAPEPPPQISPAQPVPIPVPAPSISEMPTLQFPPSNGTTDDTDKTQPYNVQQVQGLNLSLAVGARTDRGIKRQHKPNEDNYFAIQAPRPTSTLPQEFGLFVVADGMGGHANGQDASRLAIQTIIDFMLPKLSSSDSMSEDDFKNLLTEGVQCANQAVHQRNMQERADMGTTMTSALIVGPIAYVANVGDSRTYLYREPDGLVKITHDHSVVASLVDAGIIKPDDIYTHPKRNQIYRSLGEKPYVEVDTFKVPLQVGDKLLLCSDGLWDMVRDPDIQRVMSTPVPDPTRTGKALIQAALDGGGEDNVSVIVVSINEMSSQPTISGVQLIAKPETVTVPNM